MLSISGCCRFSYSLQGAFLILFLCLCVALQMLGVPVTLLDLEGSADLSAATALEGLSLPPNPLALLVHNGSSMLPEMPLTVDTPLLPNSLFHPPLI